MLAIFLVSHNIRLSGGPGRFKNRFTVHRPSAEFPATQEAPRPIGVNDPAGGPRHEKRELYFGIDLGTSNCSVACVSSRNSNAMCR